MAAPIWQNLISHRADVDPLELLPQEHNFRIHALNQRQVTTASLDELGHVGDIIVNIRTGKIVNGHLRVELAIAEAQDRVPVTYIDCDEATERIVLAFFDEVGAKAITDGDRLRATIAKIDIGSSALQASLDEWVLALKPKKVTKGKGKGGDDDEDGELLDDEPEFLDDEPDVAPAPVAAPAVAVVAPAPAPAAPAVVIDAAVIPAAVAAPEVADVSAPIASAVADAPAVVDAPVVADVPAPAASAVADAPAVAAPVVADAPALGGQAQGDDSADEVVAPAPIAPVAPVAPPPPPPVLTVVQDDPLAAAIVEDVRAAQAEDAPPAAPAPAAPTSPTEYLVKVGEFDQMVPASVFAPWFAALCAKVGNGHAALSTEIKRRLGFE